MKKLLLTLLGAALALPSMARDFTYTYEGQTLTYTVIDEDTKTVKTKAGEIDENYYIVPGNDVSGNLIIPSSIENNGISYTVTEIGKDAFDGCIGLNSVTIPNTVTKIGSFAFSRCNSLTEFIVDSNNGFYASDNGVLYSKDMAELIQYPAAKEQQVFEIPNMVTFIGGDAFSYCTGLTSVEIPNSVTTIGVRAFYLCYGLTSVTIPNSVTEIGDYAFFDCYGLTSVTIPNSVTEIGDYAFAGCTGLTSVDIPNSVTKIGDNAFWGCTGLTEIIVDEENLNYSSEDGVLYSKNKSTLIQYPIGNNQSQFEIPNSVTEIGREAFSYCTGLTSVSIPNSVTEIGEGAFACCTGLTSIEIPNFVTSIGFGAFDGCTGLTSVIIGNSVTSISGYAFACCTGLTSVTYLAENPIQSSSNIFSKETYENAILNFLNSAEEKIAATVPWSLFKNRVGRDADFVDDSSISEVENSSAEAAAVYDMRGVKVGESTEGLSKGIYIVREGSTTRKIAI